jgi:acyl-CoA oxidase
MTTDEFVINTPSLRAVKMWSGGLGVCATHAVVFAQMVIDDNPFGVQPFIVQLRSLDDHRPMKGV